MAQLPILTINSSESISESEFPAVRPINTVEFPPHKGHIVNYIH